MDQNNFINAYIDVMQEQIHAQINTDLQHRTQLRMSAGQVGALTAQITELQETIDRMVEKAKDQTKLSEELGKQEDKINQMYAKVKAHDELIIQVRNMKAEILELRAENEKLKNPPKVIRKKNDF